jgi:ferric-dicitrate binding protein FerR (iron transport regulator)
VFDLTKLKSSGDNAHSRAFDDITQVMAMIRDRNLDSPPAQRRAPSAQTPTTRRSKTVALQN